MKLTPNSLFNGEFQEINLNDFLKEHNLLDNDPAKVNHALKVAHKGHFTFGGYGENRSDMFQTTYLAKEQKFIHLGIDINVPYGTPIKSPFLECYVEDVLIDKDTDVGWGTRLVLRVPRCPWRVVLGHLWGDLGDYWNVARAWPFHSGDIIGWVGTWPENGNVFEHLHLQVIKPEAVKDGFDGYGFRSDLMDNPNPFEIEWP